jgi:hypothetical protein
MTLTIFKIFCFKKLLIEKGKNEEGLNLFFNSGWF